MLVGGERGLKGARCLPLPRPHHPLSALLDRLPADPPRGAEEGPHAGGLADSVSRRFWIHQVLPVPAQTLAGSEVVVEPPRLNEPPAHGRAAALGQVLEHVALLVADAALDWR